MFIEGFTVTSPCDHFIQFEKDPFTRLGLIYQEMATHEEQRLFSKALIGLKTGNVTAVTVFLDYFSDSSLWNMTFCCAELE